MKKEDGCDASWQSERPVKLRKPARKMLFISIIPNTELEVECWLINIESKLQNSWKDDYDAVYLMEAIYYDLFHALHPKRL